MPRIIKNPSGYQSKGRNGNEKAQRFGLYCKEHDWQGEYGPDDNLAGVVHLFARRGENETIDIWWSDSGKALPDMLPIYTMAGERIKLRNVSAAAVRVANEPEPARLGKAVRKRRRALGGTPTSVEGSYDFKDMADDEIELALLGKAVIWINSISGEVESANVEGRKTIKVYRNGRDQIHFTDSLGFHAVYLDAIVSVQ